MSAVALYPDAELVAVTYLRAALAGRAEPYAAGVRLGSAGQGGAQVGDGDQLVVGVQRDGAHRSPAASRAAAR